MGIPQEISIVNFETLNIITAVAVFCLSVLVLPLVRYIVVSKDKQIDELKAKIADGVKEHEEFNNRVHALELKVSKLESEVILANTVHTRLEKLTERLDTVVRELGSVQTALNLMMKGRVSGHSHGDFHSVKR